MEFLPAAIKRACKDYHDFMDAIADSKTAKNFSDKQSAGKAAIAHIQLLAKLSQWAGIDKKANKNDDFSDFMQVAKTEAEAFEAPEEDLA